MTVLIDGGAGVTFPDAVQQTNGLTITGGVPRYYAARAWVTFDGSTTPPTIRSAVNVASVSRSNTGLFTVTFTADMPNANYAVAGVAVPAPGAPELSVVVNLRPQPTVSSFAVRVTSLSPDAGTATTNPLNSPYVSLVVFA